MTLPLGAHAECAWDTPKLLRNVFLNRTEAARPLSDLKVSDEWVETWKKSSPEERKWLEANLFYDRDQIALNAGRETRHLLPLWDEGGFFFKDKPLEKFSRAFQDHIVNGKKIRVEDEFDIALIEKFNGILMEEKGLFKSGKFGKIRDGTQVYFNLPRSKMAQEGKLLEKNPYLNFEKDPTQPYQRVFYPKPEDTRRLLEEAVGDMKAALRASRSPEERVRAYTDFTHKLVSIHPFPDGNGRTTRFTLSYLLSQEGLPVPILEDTIDLSVSQERFYEKVVTGIRTSNRFVEDVKWRQSLGLDIKKTPMNLVSKLPDRIRFSSKGLKGTKADFPVDSYDYAQFVRSKGNKIESYAPKETRLLREYVQSVKDWSVHFVKAGKETDLYQVRRVPDESRELLKVREFKTDQIRTLHRDFYEKSEIHRGLSTQHSYTDEGLLSHFKELSNIHLSMGASRVGTGSKDKLLTKIMENQTDFNSMMEKPEKFFQHAADHMNAEGSYGQSVFLSTSKNKAVAKRFSEGFLTGEQSILKMKGQLILTALEPKHGAVDFNRLNEISGKQGSSFMSKYPRQQEVAVAGAIHPGSVMRVEFKDVEVLDVRRNTGELQAGATKVKRTRVLERLPEDPTKIKISTFDEEGNLVSERIVN
jgi:hypothetical protein